MILTFLMQTMCQYSNLWKADIWVKLKHQLNKQIVAECRKHSNNVEYYLEMNKTIFICVNDAVNDKQGV